MCHMSSREHGNTCLGRIRSHAVAISFSPAVTGEGRGGLQVLIDPQARSCVSNIYQFIAKDMVPFTESFAGAFRLTIGLVSMELVENQSGLCSEI
ncbi:hypothetical protein CDAR_112391 [Caerostris darwini]|uniref:Uncharacterized protein n=1 Tax=Caerostris darwini TaxID=1538125 RepID=A0AAV4Q2J9_9ARAC|nr:hypothetical protein CDAR_112391 [Caerostris darwini]